MAQQYFLNTLITSAPALPVTNENPTAGFQNNYSNILRLYFNQIDAFTTGVSGPLGMRYIDAPHIAVSRSLDQFATADDTSQLVLFNAAANASGFTLNPNGTVTTEAPGIYKIDFRLQLANTANDIHDTAVWLQINGTPVPNSTSIFTLQARKSAGVDNFVIAYASIIFELSKDDAIGLYWATDQAFIDAVQEGIFLSAEDAQATPYIRPAKPSASGSITFLGRL